MANLWLQRGIGGDSLECGSGVGATVGMGATRDDGVGEEAALQVQAGEQPFGDSRRNGMTEVA